jgi:hypothetical protein
MRDSIFAESTCSPHWLRLSPRMRGLGLVDLARVCVGGGGGR